MTVINRIKSCLNTPRTQLLQPDYPSKFSEDSDNTVSILRFIVSGTFVKTMLYSRY